MDTGLIVLGLIAVVVNVIVWRAIPNDDSREQINVGKDDKGNTITYIDNEDGTWSDLYNERLVSDEFVKQHIKQEE
jgi:hypothetical protein